MVELGPLPVVDLVAFGVLVLALVGLHSARVQARSAARAAAAGEPSPSSRSRARGVPWLELCTRIYQAGAWLAAWYGLAIAARIVGFA